MKTEALFVVYTPYQLISALNIAESFNGKAVFLFVAPQLKTYRDIKLPENVQIKDVTELYGNIVVGRNRMIERTKIFLRLLYLKLTIRKIISSLNKIDFLFVPSDESMCRVLYHSIKKMQPNLSLCLFDDGIGTYCNTLTIDKSKLSNMIYRCLGLEGLYEHVDAVYCYRPELMPKLQNIEVIKIENTISLEKIIKIPNSEVEKFVGKKVIFLDQGLKNKEIEHALTLLQDEFNSEEEVIVKLHPRIVTSVENTLYSCFEKSTYPLPIEVLCSLLDFDNVLLVSHSSTANITPYLLCKSHPYSVILGGLADNNNLEASVLDLFSRINDICKDDVVFIPKNEKEFDSFVKSKKTMLDFASRR